MNARFEKLFSRLESDKQQLLSELSNVSSQQFQQRPSPEKWSLAEITTHLVTAERLSLIYMMKKSRGMDALGNSGMIEWGKTVFLKISQRLPLRFNAPKAIVEHTPATYDYEQLTKEWESTRRSLKKFLESISDENARKKIYKHVIAGRLDASQALVFLREHIRHHKPQIEKILNSK